MPLAFGRDLAQMHRERRSWRRRLEWIRDALRGGAARDPERLGYVGLYLELVGTGAVACEEDGGHYRPSHHAALGLEIEGLLLGAQATEERRRVRSILRWLPSHDGRFRRAEPLTKIRDLAHRNDLPKELKNELKHRLQNKLHRSAGPEDLVTAEEILGRVTAPGANLPASFVAEYRAFCVELAEFFNAASLEQDLAAIRQGVEGEPGKLLDELSRLKPTPLDSAPRIDRELELIGRVRRWLAAAWQDGGDPPGGGDPLAQRRRLADLKLEERAFVLLSQRANLLEASGTPDDLGPVARTAALAVEQVSAIDPDQRRALGRALAQLAERQEPGEDWLFRARARFQTVRTVLGRYADGVLATDARMARELGRWLELAPHVVREFAERRIRGSLGFQLSRLADWAMATSARALALPPWEAVVAGSAEGRVVLVDRVAELGASEEPVVAVVRHLDGEEEIPPPVRALLVLHDLPHLSHVAIRARQSGVVLGVRRDSVPLDQELTQHAGEVTRVALSLDGLTVGAASEPLASPAARAAFSRVVRSSEIVELARAELETAGAKAWGARRLVEISAGGKFQAPTGWVVPFGVLRDCVGAEPGTRDNYARLLEALGAAEGAERERVAGELRALIESLPIGFAGYEALRGRLAPETRLAVRSSSNGEDLPGWVGAGLHDSIIGVLPAELRSALRRVWASLFSARAVAARKSLGMRDAQAEMAVLIEPLVPAELSFVMVTQSPFYPDEAYVELAVGLGQTLASASGEGSPYRLRIHRQRRTARLVAHASYPDAWFCSAAGIERRPVNYAEVAFGEEPSVRQALGERLAELAELLESALGGPQDVEGAVVGDELWVVQSRPGTA